VKRCAAVLVLLVTLAGCDRPRYQFINAGNGWLYRVDQETGEVIFIGGRESYRVGIPEETASRRSGLRRRWQERFLEQSGAPPLYDVDMMDMTTEPVE